PDATSTLASIAEPTLQSLNMYSIWPRGLLVRLHEFIHLDLGFGWVSTIVIGALVCRIIVLPFAIKTMRMSLAMAKIQPKLAPLQEKISAASAKGDTNQMLATRKEMMLLFEQNKVSPLGGLWGFAQIPVMIGQFMAVRSMMQNVLDPLIHSGIWLKDLTIPDPIYLVPILSTALINLQLKLASRDQDMVNRPVAGHMLNIFSLLSVVGCLFLSRLPLGLNIALLCGSLFTIVQTLVFRIPPIRSG
ncbi:60Kd inner membrane protein-domain-containing protein, partial [Flagelloscypha sp. PMI_526]